MLLVTDCKEEEPAPPSNLALTFLTEGLSPTAEVFVTDPDGNLLESEVANGQMTFFNTDGPALYYDLTIVDLTSANNYTIKTYQQVPSSSYFIKSVASPTVAGQHRISFPNVANYKNFKIQSEHLKEITTVSDTQFDLQLTQAKSNIFITLEKDASGTPSYFVLEQAEVGKTTVLDEIMLNKFIPMTAKSITAAQSITDSYHYQIYGNLNDSKQLQVSSYDPAPVFEPSPVSFYYPASNTLFTGYTTQVSFDITKGNYIATISQVQTTSIPAETADQLEAKLESYQESTGNYQFSLTGSAEWTHAQLQAAQGDKSIKWDVYTPFSEQNSIRIPDFLFSYLMSKQFSFINNLKFSLIECGNDAATLSYLDFLRLELKKDGAPINTKTRFTTSYYLPQ